MTQPPMMQQPLFTPQQCPPPKRPGFNDDRVLEATARLVLADIHRDGLDIERHDEEALEDLKVVIRGKSDGYQIGKSLDRCPHYWNVDARLVEVLDGVLHHQFDAHREIVREWVASNGIRPTMVVGGRVRFRQRGAMHEGEITRVVEDEAKYVVFCPELGHVREGTPECEQKARTTGASTGAYVYYEDATQVDAPAG